MPLGEECLDISVAEKAVRIAGGRPRGTLYGVYEFFEEMCGVRYLTRDHTYYPEGAASLKIPIGKHSFTPSFAFRWSYYGETNRHPEFAARLRTNTVGGDAKLGGITGYQLVSHNVAYLVPPAKYGAEHPEYYALVNGRRILDMHGGGPQLCMTNPDVFDLVVAAIREEIKNKPSVHNINIAHMDNESYCTCANCAAIDAREESHAGATLTLVNAVAEEIEKTHPEILISTYAYQYTRRPPKTLRARRNVMIQLCSIECCTLHAIDDPSCSPNRDFCDDMAGWKTKADHIFIWHYNTNFNGYLLPFPNLRSIGKSVDYFAKNNGRGVFMQAAGNGYSTELSDLRNYVMSRCLWKPGRDSWEEAQEFCRLHYQEAIRAIVNDMSNWAHLAHDMRVMLQDGEHESTVLIGGWRGLDGRTEPSGGSLMATTGLKIAYTITGNKQVEALYRKWIDTLGYRDEARTAKSIMGSGRGNYDDADGSLWNLQTFPTCRIFQPQLNSIRTDIEFTTHRGRKEALHPHGS